MYWFCQFTAGKFVASSDGDSIKFGLKRINRQLAFALRKLNDLETMLKGNIV